MDDPRNPLLNVFEDLLTGEAERILIEKVRKATSSADEYMKFRAVCRWTPNSAAGLHVEADSRLEYFGRLYLALALHYATSSQAIGPGGLLGFIAPEKPKQLRCDEDALLQAAAAELAFAALALKPRPSESGNIHTPVTMSLSLHSERGWDANRGLITIPNSSESAAEHIPTELSYSLGNVAIEYGSQDDDQSTEPSSTAEIAPLHIWILRPRAAPGWDYPPRSSEPFSVRFFPTLLSALNLYSSRGATQRQPGWWKTLNWVEDWVAGEYSRTLAATAPTSPSLTGPYLARWHVARSVMPAAANDRKSCYSGLVSGPSHGAAFAMGLLQAVARAHMAQPQL